MEPTNLTQGARCYRIRTSDVRRYRFGTYRQFVAIALEHTYLYRGVSYRKHTIFNSVSSYRKKHYIPCTVYSVSRLDLKEISYKTSLYRHYIVFIDSL